MGANQCFECVRNLLVFVCAGLGSLLRQIPLAHDVAERLRVGAIGDAQQVEQTLCGRAMLVGECLSISMFVYQSGLRAGAFWLPKLGDAIRESDAFVMLVGNRLGGTR